MIIEGGHRERACVAPRRASRAIARSHTRWLASGATAATPRPLAVSIPEGSATDSRSGQEQHRVDHLAARGPSRRITATGRIEEVCDELPLLVSQPQVGTLGVPAGRIRMAAMASQGVVGQFDRTES